MDKEKIKKLLNKRKRKVIMKIGKYKGGTKMRHKKERGITLIAFAISRKCVRYEERAWKPCERREKERKV